MARWRLFFYNLQYFDGLLFAYITLLIFFGFILIYSVTGAEDLAKIKTQAIALGIGLLFFLLFTFFIDYRLLTSYAWVLYLLSILLLSLLFLWGKLTRGSLAWFDIGVFHIQPAEIVKLFIIIFLAYFFHRFYERMASWGYFLLSFLLIALPSLLIFLESDLGSAALLFLIWGGMLFFTPVGLKKMSAFFLFLVIGCILGWFFLLAPYQKQRITTFLNPTQDPRGAGYNFLQVLIAVGSGGLKGRGLGHGPQSQLNFIPEVHTDFIFALGAEELGFIGVSIMLLLYFLFFRRLSSIIQNTQERLATFLVLGSFFLFIFQTTINIGMNIGLLPIVGVPLPFISYGGSALATYLMICGIIENIVLRNKSILP